VFEVGPKRNQLHLSRNTKEWYDSAADILVGDLMTTKRIYNFFMEQVTFTNYIEIKCPNIPFKKIWENLNRNYIPCDWKSTTYLIINDVLTNSFKLNKHRIVQGNIVCGKCLNIDNGVHRIKQCIVAREVMWAWIKTKLIRNLNLAMTQRSC
jgi:hypothetical protein